MPTAAHVVYIPIVLVLGIVIGYILAQQQRALSTPVTKKSSDLPRREVDASETKSSIPS